MAGAAAVTQKGGNCGPPEAAGAYVIFRAGRREFLLASERVLEIRSVPPAKDPPGGAEGPLAGSIVLHGRSVPVIALTRLLDLPPARRNSRRFVIVLPLDFPPASAPALGLLVDAVSSVVRIPAARIAPPDPAAPPASTGRVRINGRFKYLLEPALLLPPEQISQVCGFPAAVAGPVA